MKTIAERIRDNDAVITAAKDALSAIMKMTEEENRDPTEAEQIEIGEHSATIDKATATGEALHKAEESLGRQVQRTGGISSVPGQFKSGRGSEPDAVLVRAGTAHFLAHMRKQSVEQVVREIYGDDPRMEAVAKAATTNATTTQVGWAAELVHVGFQSMLQELKPDYIYARLAALGMTIDFGNSGSISIPRRNPGGLSGAFIQEGATIPVKMGSLGSATMNRYKMGVISSFSQELARSSVPGIEGVIRDGIKTDTATAIDAALLDGAAAVAAVRPASILAGVTGTASSGTTVSNILTDMKVLLNSMYAINAGMKLVTIMNPQHVLGLSTVVTANGVFMFKDEVANGHIMGTILLASTTVPVGKVIMIDAVDFMTALGSPEFEVSDSATLVMASDTGAAPVMTPQGAITVAGSIPVSGAAGTTPPTAVQSLFQTWSVAVRMVMPLSWGLRRAGTVNQITGVAW